MSRALTAVLDGEGTLRAPTVGTWSPALSAGAWVQGRTVLGTLTQLGRPSRVLAPEGAWGQVEPITPAGTWVPYAAPLLRLGVVEGAARAPQRAEEQAAGLVALRAPMAGTLYRRPKPGMPEYAPVGAALAPRATVALVEVMKTFTALVLEGGGRVERWVVEDGASVEADQVLAWVRPPG